MGLLGVVNSRTRPFLVVWLPLLATTACADMSSLPPALDPAAAASDAVPIPDGATTVRQNGHPGDDPRAWTFEDLENPADRLDRLAKGQCVLQYHRGNGKYSPIPYVLHYDRGAESPGPGVRIVVTLNRTEGPPAVRALCVTPHDVEPQTEAIQDLDRRIRKKAFYRDEDGHIKLYHPSDPRGALNLHLPEWMRPFASGRAPSRAS